MAEKHIFSSDTLLSPDSLGRKPTILVNIAQDDATRGDTAGRKGLAQAMAHKIGADVLYADENTLDDLYPDKEKPNNSQSVPKYQQYNNKLHQYLSDHRPPDIVLGFNCPDPLHRLGKNVNQTHYIEEVNESLSRNLIEENNIVAHHLTNEMLKEEGIKFDEAYPDLKKPIISIFLVDPYSDEQKRFIKKMVEVTEEYKDATIFLCGSRRTSPANYDLLETNLKKSLNESGINNNINVKGFKFDRNAEFNPYRGLIARSDHFVLWGDSMSMMSEPLITGKTVHLYQYGVMSSKLLEQNVISELDTSNNYNDEPYETSLKTTNFDPINITDKLADKIIGEFKKRTDHIIERQSVRDERHPIEWQSHLSHIYFDHNHIKDIPDDMLQNDDFIKAALESNGFSLIHLTKEQQKSPIFVTPATISNVHMFKYADDTIKGDEKIMARLVRMHLALYKECSDELKKNPDFNLLLLENSVDIFRDGIFGEGMSVNLMKHEEISLQVIQYNTDHAKHIPEFLYNDPDFVHKVLQANPDCFRYIPDIYKDDEKIVRHVMEKNSNLIQYASEKIHDNEDIMLDAIILNARNIRHSSERLYDSQDFTKKAMQRIDVSEYMSIEFYHDKDIMLPAVKLRPNNYLRCSEDLQSDPDICIAAVQNVTRFWDHFPQEMQENADVAIAVLHTNDSIWNSLPDKLQKDPEFSLRCLQELEDFPPDYIHESLMDNSDFIKKVVEIKPEWANRPCFAKALGNDTDFFDTPDNCIIELRRDLSDWKYVPDTVKKDPEFLIRCLRTIPSFHPALIDSNLREDYDFVKRIVDVKPKWRNIPVFFDILKDGAQATTEQPPLHNAFNDKLITDNIILESEIDTISLNDIIASAGVKLPTFDSEQLAHIAFKAGMNSTSFNALALTSGADIASFGSEQVKELNKLHQKLTENPLKPLKPKAKG